MICANCGKEILYGDKYLSADEHNLCFYDPEYTKGKGLRFNRVRADAICMDCVEEMIESNEG